MPKVIHYRGLNFSDKYKEDIRALKANGIIIFNEWNRYTKLDVYDVLNQYDEIKDYLPKTKKATSENVHSMLKEFSKLIIKPNSSSLGLGVMKLEKIAKDHVLTYYSRKSKNWCKLTFTEEFPEVLSRKLKTGKYIVQEYIELARYKGNPFDLRVSCQKNENGKWQVTGMVGKVAMRKSIVTNVAKGGTVQRFSTLINDTSLNRKEIKSKINRLSLQIAKILEIHFPNLADIGLDIGITKDGVPKFIECNGRDLRYSFRNGKMYKTWKKTYATPMGYARYLIDQESFT